MNIAKEPVKPPLELKTIAVPLNQMNLIGEMISGIGNVYSYANRKDNYLINLGAGNGIRTHEHLRDWTLNPAPLTWLGNPRE